MFPPFSASLPAKAWQFHYYGNQTVLFLHHVSSPRKLISESQHVCNSLEIVLAGDDEWIVETQSSYGLGMLRHKGKIKSWLMFRLVPDTMKGF